jgi:hypothetical protein
MGKNIWFSKTVENHEKKICGFQMVLKTMENHEEKICGFQMVLKTMEKP